MPYSLILDTTSKYLVCGLANEKVIDKTIYECWQRQSEFLVLEIDKILKRNNLTANDISKIIVTNGPGSYTGIRIALTVAKVWNLSKNIPVCVLSSLQAMCGMNKNSLAILDARSNRFYCGFYSNGIALKKDCILEKEALIEYINKNNNINIFGDTSLLGLKETEIDYCNNMLELSKIVKETKDCDRLVQLGITVAKEEGSEEDDN